MLPENKTKTNIGVGLGIILQIAGRFFARQKPELAIVGLVMILVGAILFIWGCMNYAEGKGHSKWLGLLGLLSCIGLIVLIVLPDRHKDA
jgi:hypothetical protein